MRIATPPELRRSSRDSVGGMNGHGRGLPSPPRFGFAPRLGGTVVAAALLALAGCTYYEITHPDGSRERISREEFEELNRTANRIGNAPAVKRSPPVPATKPE